MPLLTKSKICTLSSKSIVTGCFDLKKPPVKEDQGGQLGNGLIWKDISVQRVPGGNTVFKKYVVNNKQSKKNGSPWLSHVFSLQLFRRMMLKANMLEKYMRFMLLT